MCYKSNQKGHYSNECQNQMAGTVFYKCRKFGHIAKDSKTPVPVNNMLILEGAPPISNQPRDRTFNMTMGDAIHNTYVVVGALPINSALAKVLIDSGATKSFISKEFAHRFCKALCNTM